MRDDVMDESDMATEKEMRDNAILIELARNSPPLPSTGSCYNCADPVADGLRFCDTDCRDDWQKRGGK